MGVVGGLQCQLELDIGFPPIPISQLASTSNKCNALSDERRSSREKQKYYFILLYHIIRIAPTIVLALPS